MSCLIHLFSQFDILLRPTQMDPFSQSLKLPTIHTSFTIKTQLPGLVAFGKNRDQTLLALFIHIIKLFTQQIPHMTKSHHGGNMSLIGEVGFCHRHIPTIDNYDDEVGLGVFVDL